jgi:hypothetical protein
VDDYTETVRKMKTSALLQTLIGNIKHAHDIVDPERDLRCRLRPGFDRWGTPESDRASREADDELYKRTSTLYATLAAEIDRRIPIPEGS